MDLGGGPGRDSASCRDYLDLADSDLALRRPLRLIRIHVVGDAVRAPLWDRAPCHPRRTQPVHLRPARRHLAEPQLAPCPPRASDRTLESSSPTGGGGWQHVSRLPALVLLQDVARAEENGRACRKQV